MTNMRVLFIFVVIVLRSIVFQKHVTTASYITNSIIKQQQNQHQQLFSIAKQQNIPTRRLMLKMVRVPISVSESVVGDRNSNNTTNGSTVVEGYNEATTTTTTMTKYKVCLMVEPTPFGYVCGYSNRFKEMLHYLKIAGDDVCIVTTIDNKILNTITQQQQQNQQSTSTSTSTNIVPTNFVGYNITYTKGYTLSKQCNNICVTFDLPQMKGYHVIKQLKPDLIHVTSPGILLFATILYARIMNIPLLISYHTHLPILGRIYLRFIPCIEWIGWMIIKITHSFADLTLVTSPQIKDEFIIHNIPRVDVWRKGIDTIKFHPKFYSNTMRNRMTNNNPNDLLIVYVGRISIEKRLKDIKPVLDQLHLLGINVRMCFVGDGPPKDELVQYFTNDSSNSNNNVVFLGLLHGDELSSAFASADVFLMPSDSETLGFVVLESMASGVPVIGCAAGCIIDIIHDSIDGYLVQPGNITGYVEKIQLLSSNIPLRKQLGQQARAEAELWGWDTATSYLRNVQYKQAIENFNHRRRHRQSSQWTIVQSTIYKFVHNIIHQITISYKFVSITIAKIINRLFYFQTKQQQQNE